LESGVNLLQDVFQELTRDQAKRLGVVGEKLRMDSTLLDSNLATCTRLQVIIGWLQEFWKSLSEEEKARLEEADRALLDRLCAKRASQIIYGLQEATYRKKKDESVRGYSANVTETCEGELNLIVDVQVEPATAAKNSYLNEAVQNSEEVLGGTAREISADGAYYSEEKEAYAKDQEKKIHYTGFPGKPGRYDHERTDDGVVVIDRESGERQLAEEYKAGRYRFRVDGKWRYITDKDIDAAACRRRAQHLLRELFNRRCNVEATIFQLCYHTGKKKLKYRGQVSGPAVGHMPRGMDQHETHCELPGQTSRGACLIDGPG
jgi:hypothetical protein